jgi:hypothetical protein
VADHGSAISNRLALDASCHEAGTKAGPGDEGNEVTFLGFAVQTCPDVQRADVRRADVRRADV